MGRGWEAETEAWRREEVGAGIGTEAGAETKAGIEEKNAKVSGELNRKLLIF